YRLPSTGNFSPFSSTSNASTSEISVSPVRTPCPLESLSPRFTSYSVYKDKSIFPDLLLYSASSLIFSSRFSLLTPIAVSAPFSDCSSFSIFSFKLYFLFLHLSIIFFFRINVLSQESADLFCCLFSLKNQCRNCFLVILGGNNASIGKTGVYACKFSIVYEQPGHIGIRLKRCVFLRKINVLRTVRMMVFLINIS